VKLGRARRLGHGGAAVWLVLLGLGSVVVGGHDLLAGRGIGSRLAGMFLLGAGLLLIGGAAALLSRRPAGHAVALVAALMGTAIGLLLSLTQVANDEPDRRLAAWAAIVVLSFLAALAVWRAAPTSERRAATWKRLRLLNSVVSVGVLLSAVQFWYSSIHLPTTAAPSLTIELELERGVTRKGLVALRGRAVVRNTSGAKVSTLGSVLAVRGREIAPWTLGAREFGEQVRTSVVDGTIAPGRFAQVTATRLVQSQSLVAPGTWFEPGESVTVPILAWIPRKQFDEAELTASIYVSRGARLRNDLAVPHTYAERGRLVTVMQVPESGWLQALTQGDRFVRVEQPVDLTRPGRVWISSEPRRRPSSDFDGRMQQFYGLAAQQVETLLPL
jgi:hypothetical protein